MHPLLLAYVYDLHCRATDISLMAYVCDIHCCVADECPSLLAYVCDLYCRAIDKFFTVGLCM